MSDSVKVMFMSRMYICTTFPTFVEVVLPQLLPEIVTRQDKFNIQYYIQTTNQQLFQVFKTVARILMAFHLEEVKLCYSTEWINKASVACPIMLFVVWLAFTNCRHNCTYPIVKSQLDFGQGLPDYNWPHCCCLQMNGIYWLNTDLTTKQIVVWINLSWR